ncbi:uncharacterized protein Z518_07219 [Rhinocladiella mackenziei CBS 650.93]|uniref:Kinesin light chain n=1 Tax=Rhinocladiella mackenziei CBS 650.93 TaxID=1442369 RepID=A0A0D2IKA1_9EURO|nr:uncharacterized protein Z518_07219 [Rhinocladiella mackenziei CBS 650.93]KIX03666.1 hypothetical protein Z518_07219 [Rhinocladiella mackenziei CBS 650.93]
MDEPEEEVIKLLSEDFGDQSRYSDAHNAVATTWLISFQQIRKYHPLPAQFLSFIACLCEKNIPQPLLPEVGSKKDLVDAIATLKGYSFITKQTEDRGGKNHEVLYDMHRLVRLAARNWLKTERTLSDWTKAGVLRVAELFPTRDYKHKGTWTVLLPHAQRLCEDIEDRDLPERYQLLEKMGLCFVVDGKYNEAVKAHITVAQWRENSLETSKEQILGAYNNLGEAFNLKGDLPAVEVYLQKALKGRKEILGAEHPSTLTNMANLASTYRNQGRWKEAEELNVQVTEMRKRVLGEEHPDTLTSVSNLASMFWDQGRWKEAEELEVQVMETRKRVLGPKHPDTLTSMRNLAYTLKNLSRGEEAIELMTSYQELMVKVLGPSDHRTRGVLKTLMTWSGAGDNTSYRGLRC